MRLSSVSKSQRKKASSFALVTVAALCCGMLAATAGAQTADDLVAKNIEAKGGLEKIRAISSLRKTGKLEPQGFAIAIGIISEQKPDNKLRQSASIQGMSQVIAYDGTQGWQINPFQGRRDPELVDEDTSRDLAEGADFYGDLVDYGKKGSKVEYVGHATVDGDDALLLKVTLKSGDIVKYFLDPDTYLEIRTERQIFVRGSVRESYTDLGSYKKVNGVYFPFSGESGSLHNPGGGSKFTYSAIEANVEIPDSEFKMPEAAKAAAPAVKPSK